MNWLQTDAMTPSKDYRQRAQARQLSLTKPAGSLGQLEQLAVTLASLQTTDSPACDQVHITIFAGDHGVAAEGVSAFPQTVTAQMVHNFSSGGAAIAVIARSLGARLSVINTGTVSKLPELPGVIDKRIAAGTANFAQQAAMSTTQLHDALDIGRAAITNAKATGAQLWIGGEMGIANTTAATALACAQLQLPAAQLVGPGTGLDSRGQSHKATIIENALSRFQAETQSPLENLQCLGGFEIAALSGAYIAAAQIGLPVLVDGFICSVAALYAQAINPSVAPWLLLSHQSAEPGHQQVLQQFDHQPLFNLGLRLGEGSGAASAVPLLRLACELHNQMATFADASVDERN